MCISINVFIISIYPVKYDNLNYVVWMKQHYLEVHNNVPICIWLTKCISVLSYGYSSWFFLNILLNWIDNYIFSYFNRILKINIFCNVNINAPS